MPKVVRIKKTGKTIYRQEPDFTAGNGILSACTAYGYNPGDLVEVGLSQLEYDNDLEAEIKPSHDLIAARKILADKYVSKTSTDITDADALEWVRLQMVMEILINE